MKMYTPEDFIPAGTLVVLAGEIYIVIKDKIPDEGYICLFTGIGDMEYPVSWCWALTENTILQRKDYAKKNKQI